MDDGEANERRVNNRELLAVSTLVLIAMQASLIAFKWKLHNFNFSRLILQT